MKKLYPGKSIVHPNEILKVVSYPRSGSNYLNYALHLIYYPEKAINPSHYTVAQLELNSSSIVPFRNPLDAISSWKNYPTQSELKKDIKFYIRFYNGILNNLNKIVLMDFDVFTKDVNYIKNTILKEFGISTDKNVVEYQIKKAMLLDGKEINLPRDNKNELDLIKEKLQKMPEFNECLSLYNAIKQRHYYSL